MNDARPGGIAHTEQQIAGGTLSDEEFDRLLRNDAKRMDEIIENVIDVPGARQRVEKIIQSRTAATNTNS